MSDLSFRHEVVLNFKEYGLVFHLFIFLSLDKLFQTFQVKFTKLFPVHWHIHIQLLDIWQNFHVCFFPDFHTCLTFAFTSLWLYFFNCFSQVLHFCVFGKVFFPDESDLHFKWRVCNFVDLFCRVKRIININIEIGKLFEKSDFLQLHHITFNKGMPEIGSFICFEIAEFLEELWYLNNYSENVFVRWVVVHWKSFDCLVVLYHRVEAFFL